MSLSRISSIGHTLINIHAYLFITPINYASRYTPRAKTAYTDSTHQMD